MKATIKAINHRLHRHVVPWVVRWWGITPLNTGSKIVLLASVLTSALVTGMKVATILEPAELFLFDRLVRSLPSEDLDPRMTIVGITEADIRQYGWPLSDQVLAQVINQIQNYQPRVVGLDLYRSTPRPPGSSELIEELANPNLVAIRNVGSTQGQSEVPPPPTVDRDRVGFNDFPTDSDGIIRRNLIFVRSQEGGYYSFALRVIMAYAGYSADALRAEENYLYLGDRAIPVLSAQDGGYQNVDSRGYQILLRYYTAQMPAQHISISQALSGQFDPDWITDNIVLIGTAAASLKDRFYTPFSFNQDNELTMPGVAIHGQMIRQMLDIVDGQLALYRFLPQWAEGLWLWGWCLAAGGLAWGIKRPSLLLLASSLLIAGLIGIGWLGVSRLLWIPLIEPTTGMIGTIAGVLAYKLLYRTTHDSLTGLPNREAFMGTIQQALHHRRPTEPPVIVAFMGIDRFKVINESLGHQVGDEVLQMMAQRLVQHMPPEAQIAKVGGDEFALLLTHLPSSEARDLIDRLQDALSEPFTLRGQKLPSTLSIGVAISQPELEHKPANLLRDAHTAMYRAKALGRSRFEVFAAGMLADAVNRLQLESDLLSALDNHEFLLYYQPIINLKTQQLAGFEALVRWRQKDRGFVLPSAFIPAAEETGLIMALGQWIFREACWQLRSWHDQFPQHRHLTMSINLSNRQFGQPNLIAQIETALQETQVNGHCVRLEITESMVMGDVDAAIDLMLKLKSLDLKLAIDDFGTGYSSLSYLHRFPMDTLKVDKSFVGRLEKSNEDRAIIHTILTLGQKLGMEVVAEGVETETQVAMLCQEGCDYGQGYFFAKPLPAADAFALLQKHPL
ncbi:EAL domain-containing protein [Nodosilinea sp. LEGE 07088]|uniref:putative bifunctional diguanylate cyclase/phosphodiesterase n=1 Tax=Nodosilinea sp. LEGE 07088 TaxID=2777968 RepID=UPI0018823A0B|nr:EAL domain-containing protein [Nodosilinea sp. LEGE 07088]MBE9137403.1 EAL domain-containing protein [Nodosilinea sp. LEGE 07088]